MKRISIRRIAMSLLAVAVIGFSFSTVVIMPNSCDSFTTCLAAVPVYSLDFTVNQSTVSHNLNPAAITFSDITNVVQATSTYLLILAVLILVALELVELHYVRMIFLRRRN